jgi:hypothetical protein
MRGFLTVCADPDCPELVSRGYCARHAREAEREIRQRSSEWRWVYRDRRWRALRRQVRQEQPWCDEEGCMELGHDLDHVVSLQDGGPPFDRGNVHMLCKVHHSRKTSEEVRDRRAL